MRKQKDVTIVSAGRDKGKVFRITEMSAYDSVKWSRRATTMLLPKLNEQIPPEVIAQINENPDILAVERMGLILGGIELDGMDALVSELQNKCILYVDA